MFNLLQPTPLFFRILVVALAIATVPIFADLTLAQSSPEFGASLSAGEDQVAPMAKENPIPTKNLLQVLHEGGPLLIPIGVCSFILLVFVFRVILDILSPSGRVWANRPKSTSEDF